MYCQIFARILPLILIVAFSACTGSEDSSSNSKTGKGVIDASLGDLESLPGALLTRKKCGSCHSLDSNSRKVGPPLQGIFGRAPKISGMPYAVWDEKALDEWIENPTKVKPRTTMAIPGNKSAEERAVIIEYLKHI